jgi:glycosyltransferase involved in cell wall biosynthesis
MKPGEPEFSLIVTSYFEEDSLDEFYSRLRSAAESLGRPYEIVMVNDGSTDRTFEIMKEYFDRDPRVRVVIDFYRNAGQVNAMTAGLSHARGKAIVFMDSDLQLDPEELPLLVAEFDKGYDIVSGYRKDRKDSLLRKIPSQLANVVMRKVARHKLTDFGCTYKIYDAKLVRAFEFGPFKTWRTAYVFSRAQRCAEVSITHHERRYGSSGWTFSKLFGFYMDHLVGITERPFQLISLLTLGLAGLFALRILLAWTIPGTILPVVTPGMILNAIAFSFFVLLSVLSAIGEYVMRSYLISQRYPSYVIRTIHDKNDKNAEDTV